MARPTLTTSTATLRATALIRIPGMPVITSPVVVVRPFITTQGEADTRLKTAAVERMNIRII